MAYLKINKLDEKLIEKIKSSINSSSGSNWKKQWTCANMPINGISGKPFTGKTEFYLFLVNSNLNSKGIEGNRWFTINQVYKENLWKESKYKTNEKGEEELVPTEIMAYAESPFFVVSYEDPITNENQDYFYKEKNRSILYASEINKAIDELKAKGIDSSTITTRIAGCKLIPLYHESQLDEEALKNIKTPKIRNNHELQNLNIDEINKIAKSIKLNAFITDDAKSMGNAFYSPKDDTVILPSISSFKDKEAFYATAFHEITHSTGHPTRLNRKIENSFGTIDYAKEELVAEIGSIFLCNQYRVDSEKQIQNHGEYLKNWLNTFEKDTKKQDYEILKAINQASKAFDYVNNSLDKTLEKERVVLNNPELTDSPVAYAGVAKDNKEINKDDLNL